VKKQLNKKGFTLIEVVLVLAIGGLIFLLAFIAFRQASINRRDTQRRSDAGRFVAEASNYAGDNNGTPPNSSYYALNFVPQYLAPFNDPRNTPYQSKDALSKLTTASDYFYSTGYKCSGNTAVTSTSANDYAIVMKLEKGQVCRDSST